MEGWIKLHRKLLNNPTVMKNTLHISLWIYLLLNAAHEDYSFSLGGTLITLKPGQVAVYTDELAKKFRVDQKTINRALNDFEMATQVRQKKYRKGRIITVLKWDDYQDKSDKSPTKVRQTRRKKKEII